MLETIFNWTVSAIGEALEAIVNIVFAYLGLDMRQYIQIFPIFGEAYEIFRAIGIGLVIVFAAVGLAQFQFGELEDQSETPWQVLIRSFIAIGLIYVGGYVLIWIIDIAKTPYDAMLQLNSNKTLTSGFGNALKAIGTSILNIPDNIADNVQHPINFALGTAPSTLLSAVVTICIAWNLMKLIVEVFERVLMVAVMTYSAPLAFSTFATKRSSAILKKWISMFISQCLLMTLSVWTLKLICSGFDIVATDIDNQVPYLIRFVLTLAMCKIAQRIDNYLQQLGLNPATTGGNLLDDVMGLALMFGRFAGRGGRADSTLGERIPKEFSGPDTAVNLDSKTGMVTMTNSKGAVGVFGDKNAMEAYAAAHPGEKFTNLGQTPPREIVDLAKENAKRAAEREGGGSDMQKNAQRTEKAIGGYNKAVHSVPAVPFKSTLSEDGNIELNSAAKHAGLKMDGVFENGSKKATTVVTGSDDAVAATLAKSFNEYGLRNGDLAKQQDQIMHDTARLHSSGTAETAMMDERSPAMMHETPDNNIDEKTGTPTTGMQPEKYHNDAYANTMMHKLTQGVPGLEDGQFSNATGVTHLDAPQRGKNAGQYSSVGRAWYSNWTDNKTGETYGVTVASEKAYQNMGPELRGKESDWTAIDSHTGSGEKLYVRKDPVEATSADGGARQYTGAPAYSSDQVQEMKDSGRWDQIKDQYVPREYAGQPDVPAVKDPATGKVTTPAIDGTPDTPDDTGRYHIFVKKPSAPVSISSGRGENGNNTVSPKYSDKSGMSGIRVGEISTKASPSEQMTNGSKRPAR